MGFLEFSIRSSPCRETILKRFPDAGQIGSRRKGVGVLFILAGLLLVLGLAKAGSLSGISTLTQRVLKLNRIAEPIAQSSSDHAVVVEATTSQSHEIAVVVPTTYPELNIVRPSLTLSRSTNQFRSPPRIE
jgi:hypothetical protein